VPVNPTADETDDDLIPARPAAEDSLVSKQDDKRRILAHSPETWLEASL